MRPYEEFARALQNEYEEDCGVTFGKVPLTALARIVRVRAGQEQPIGRAGAEALRAALVAQNLLDPNGRIQPAFDPRRPGFSLNLPGEYQDLAPAVIDLLSSYQIEHHIRPETFEVPNRLKKQVQLDPDFAALWERIRPKTTYRVEFETDELVQRAAAALKRMEPILAPAITVSAGQVGLTRGGVTTRAVSVAEEKPAYRLQAIPDVLAYLQNETELTRATLVRILTESGRLGEFFIDPQRFMDAAAQHIRHELHRLLVDGIQYERIAGSGPAAEWEMHLFKNEEMINYLTALPVNKSIYEYIVYDSEVERAFAQKLDQREDIKLFVKLPAWFQVDTPLGSYNPDWAIVKETDGAAALYLVRETKATRDVLQLRTGEADKIRCGQKHFAALDVSFDVVVTDREV